MLLNIDKISHISEKISIIDGPITDQHSNKLDKNMFNHELARYDIDINMHPFDSSDDNRNNPLQEEVYDNNNIVESLPSSSFNTSKVGLNGNYNGIQVQNSAFNSNLLGFNSNILLLNQKNNSRNGAEKNNISSTFNLINTDRDTYQNPLVMRGSLEKDHSTNGDTQNFQQCSNSSSNNNQANDEMKNKIRDEQDDKSELIKFLLYGSSTLSSNIPINNSLTLIKVDKKKKEEKLKTGQIKLLHDMNHYPCSLPVSKNITPNESRYNSPKSRDNPMNMTPNGSRENSSNSRDDQRSDFTFNQKNKKEERTINSAQSSLKAIATSNFIYL